MKEIKREGGGDEPLSDKHDQITIDDDIDVEKSDELPMVVTNDTSKSESNAKSEDKHQMNGGKQTIDVKQPPPKAKHHLPGLVLKPQNTLIRRNGSMTSTGGGGRKAKAPRKANNKPIATATTTTNGLTITPVIRNNNATTTETSTTNNQNGENNKHQTETTTSEDQPQDLSVRKRDQVCQTEQALAAQAQLSQSQSLLNQQLQMQQSGLLLKLLPSLLAMTQNGGGAEGVATGNQSRDLLWLRTILLMMARYRDLFQKTLATKEQQQQQQSQNGKVSEDNQKSNLPANPSALLAGLSLLQNGLV